MICSQDVQNIHKHLQGAGKSRRCYLVKVPILYTHSHELVVFLLILDAKSIL
jgi:hypothetical protein